MKKFGILAVLLGLMGCATAPTVPETPRETTPCEYAANIVKQVGAETQKEEPSATLNLEYCHLIEDGDNDFILGVVVGHYCAEDQTHEDSLAVVFRKVDGKWGLVGSKPLYTGAPIPTAPKCVSKPSTQPSRDDAHDVQTPKNAL